MPRTGVKFTQAAIARALRGARDAGVQVEVVIEPNGAIRLVPATERDRPAGQLVRRDRPRL